MIYGSSSTHFKKENQLQHFIVRSPSIDPNDIPQLQYEVRAPGVLQNDTFYIETLPTLFPLSKLQMEFAKVQASELIAS